MSQSVLYKKYAAFVVIFIVIIILALVFGVGRDSRKEIKIGAILPLEGDAQDYGMQTKYVFDYTIDTVNDDDATKEAGVKFKIEYENGNCDSQEAEQAYEKLRDKGISFILGGFCSAETLAITPSLNQDKVLVVSPASSSAQLEEQQTEFLFSLSYSDQVIASNIAEELAQEQYQRIAIISEDNEWNQHIRSGVTEALIREQGVSSRVVFDEAFDKGSKNFSSILEELQSENPDVIFLNPNVGDTAVELVKSISKIQSLGTVQLVGQGAFIGQKVLNASPETLENMIIIDAPVVESSQLNSIKEKIEDMYNTELTELSKYYTASSFDSVKVLTSYITDVFEDDIADATLVRNKFVNDTYPGLIGSIRFEDSKFVDVGSGKYEVMSGKVLPYGGAGSI